MRIVYITHNNTRDKNVGSGTIYNIYKMLVDFGHEVTVVSNLKYPFFLKAYNKVKHSILGKKNIPLFMNKSLLKSYARQIRKQTRKLEYDLVFSPIGTYYSYYVDEKPMVYFIDSNVGCVMGYYYDPNTFTKKAVKDAYAIEDAAVQNSSLAIYASNWARDAAIKYHSGDPEKIVAINRGANVEHTLTADQIAERIAKRRISLGQKSCQLLFVGIDWERKGGIIACEVTRALNEIGYPAKLVVIGCDPRIPENCKQYVEVLGFLSKNKPEQYRLIDKAYAESDFFLLPTQAECQGISYIEACAWGTPPIGCITGGVGDVVIDNVTGFQLPTDASAEEYAQKIAHYINNPDEYVKLANSAFAYYQKNMTWKAVGQRIFKQIEEKLGLK